MDDTPFARLTHLGEQLQATSKRSELTALVAEFLKELAPKEIPPAVRLTIGQIFPEWDGRALNVSWRALMAVVDGLVDVPASVRDRVAAQAVDGGEFVQLLLEEGRRQASLQPGNGAAPPAIAPTEEGPVDAASAPPAESSENETAAATSPSQTEGTEGIEGEPPSQLTILDVYGTLEAIAATVGRGSRARKEDLLRGLLQRATPLEAKVLAKVIYQEMRHGVSEGLMLDGIAQAAGIKARTVRRANQMWGDVGEVALVAMTQGQEALRQASVRPFRPIKPMLAQTVDDLSEAMARAEGQLALEYKLDGARVQIHRQADKVRIYSRQLADVTASLPDVAIEIDDKLAASEAVLDGEVVAVDASGRPLPFQHLMRRFRRVHNVAETIAEIPVQLHLFDAMYVDGQSLVDLPYQERWAALEQAAGELRLVRRLIPSTVDEGEAFAEDSRRDGHEGLMAKNTASAYSPGVRGKAWLKLKHVTSLDLVIIAADWGYGRRHGWLSNYHLAVRDETTGDYRLVGKTFKGPTDAEFQTMTQRLLSLERSRKRGTVFVEPQVVVEVLFNEIQESSQYESGLALRFARIARLREDKEATDADTFQTLRHLYEKQFEFKGRLKA